MKPLIGLALALFSASGFALEGEVMPYPSLGQVPPGYPAEYLSTVRAAENEGRLVIYSTTDSAVARPLIDDFRRLYPRIELQFEDLNSTVLQHRFVAETQLGPESADVLWSSAMDQQSSLVSNGYALTYESPESANLPDWAKWKSQAYATTYEPIVFVYNKQLLAAADVPQTHADLARMLASDASRFTGKLTTYDIEKSGVGFFLATQDVGAGPAFWEIARGLLRGKAKQELTTDAMVKRVASGQALLAYNVLGSYAIAQARNNPAIGTVFPKDYTLVASRIVFINKKASNPNAAKLWLDYTLSKRGQTVIANEAHLYAVRSDVQGVTTASSLAKELGASLRPIAVGPGLIGYLNNQNYKDFIQQWKRIESGP